MAIVKLTIDEAIRAARVINEEATSRVGETSSLLSIIGAAIDEAIDVAKTTQGKQGRVTINITDKPTL